MIRINAYVYHNITFLQNLVAVVNYYDIIYTNLVLKRYLANGRKETAFL